MLPDVSVDETKAVSSGTELRWRLDTSLSRLRDEFMTQVYGIYSIRRATMRKITQPLHIMKAGPPFRHSRALLNLLLKWRHLYRLLERSPRNQGTLHPPDSLVQTNEAADNSNTPYTLILIFNLS
jgi:hypothetical protein